MIKELCFQLAEKRKKSGLSVEDVADKTKLCPSVIRDIEDANLTNINTVYFRGFIKIYASFLEVDMVEGIFDEVTSTKTESLKAASSADKLSQKGESVLSGGKIENKKYVQRVKVKIPPHLIRKLCLFALGIAVVFSLVSFSKFVVKKILSAERSFRVVKKEKKNPPIKENKIISSQDMVKNLLQEQDIETSLKVKRDCFIRVKVDGRLLFEGILNKGTVEIWKGTKEVEFKISDGSAVYLEVNGNPLPQLTSMRKPIKSLKINHSGVSVDK